MLAPITETPAPYSLEGEAKVTLLDLFIVLAEMKWVWILGAIGCGVLAYLLSFFLPVEYRAETSIFPPVRPVSSTSMLMGQVGSALSMGGSPIFGAKDPNDMLLALLHSRTVADTLVKRFHLQSVYGVKDPFLAEEKLEKRSTIVSTLEGTILVKVEDKDPRRAAAIANAYIEELTRQNDRLAITEAARRRNFFQAQLGSEKNALEDAEVSLKETELKTGVLELTGQTELAIRQVANYRAQITENELELRNLLMSETPGNPDVARLEERIQSLKGDLETVQGKQSGKLPADGTLITTSTVPSLAVEYVRKMREVKYHEELLNVLSRQYEAARIDEAKEAPAIDSIDVAVPPHFPYSPRRPLLAAAGLAIGLVLGWFYVIIAEMASRSLKEPEYAEKWVALQRAIRGWK